MTQEKPGPKSRPSLGATIGVSVILGATAGYLVGSGIEDILRAFSVEPPVLLIKAIPSGLGALGLSALGFLQYLNKDEHEGMLVMHVVEGVEPRKPAVQPQPDLEGLAHAVEGLTSGVENKALAQRIYSEITGALGQNPLSNLRVAYESNKNGLWAGQFEVFKPFQYERRVIDPKATLDSFFETGDTLHRLAVEGLSNAAGRVVTGNGHFGRNQQKAWSGKFRKVLDQEIELAQDAALWLTYLSKRGGIVGSKVRDQLAQLGITNPDYLARDIKALGDNVLRLYDRLQKEI